MSKISTYNSTVIVRDPNIDQQDGSRKLNGGPMSQIAIDEATFVYEDLEGDAQDYSKLQQRAYSSRPLNSGFVLEKAGTEGQEAIAHWLM